MKYCYKCQGDNFVRVAKSTVIPTLTFHLCECGNVMMEDSTMKGILLPTPEDNGVFTKAMMEDASKAFGIPMSLGYLKEEDRPQAASKFAEMLQEYFSSLPDDEDEYLSDYPAGECDYECDECDCYCDDCGECEEYCYCDDEEDDYAEELDEVVHFLDMIVQFADADPEFLEVWNDLRNSGELVDLVEDILDENGLDASDLLAQKNELVKMVPAPFQEDELLAKVISVFASKDIQKATDKARREKASKSTADHLEGEISLDKLVKAARKIAKETEKEPVVAGPQSLLEKLAAIKVTEAIKESIDAPDVKLEDKQLAKIEQIIEQMSTVKTKQDSITCSVKSNACERIATYDDEIEEDKEETKSYVVLNRNGSWKIYENMTKEEMSDALNEDDDIEDFKIYEIKNVNMAGRVVFSIKE